MRSRLIPAVGALAGLVLGLLVVVGVALEEWVLTAAAASALGVALLAVQLDTWRRSRSLRTYVRDEVRRARPQAQPSGFAGSVQSSVTHDDVVGAVRLMQAQYTGRLDRMQRALDDALAELSSQRSGPDAR